MPSVGTEVKWHSNKSGIVKQGFASTYQRNEAVNGYSICTVHVMYSLKLSRSGQNSEESSNGACSFGGSRASRLLSDCMLASHPISRFSAA